MAVRTHFYDNRKKRTHLHVGGASSLAREGGNWLRNASRVGQNVNHGGEVALVPPNPHHQQHHQPMGDRHSLNASKYLNSATIFHQFFQPIFFVLVLNIEVFQIKFS